MGIRDKPTASASPWQNGFAEQLIGSIRRECADHIIVFGEAHLRRILRSYACYYNGIRTHRSWTRMRRSPARFSGPVSLIHAPSLADSITNTPEFRFSVHTPLGVSRGSPSLFLPVIKILLKLESRCAAGLFGILGQRLAVFFPKSP
jgi:hypothetical protein